MYQLRPGCPAGQIQPANAAKRTRGNVPGHAVVAEVGQRMPECGQFPVQHGDDARLGRVKHQVVQTVVAMHDADHVFGARHAGNVLGSHSINLSISIIGW
jgi:hypothetical protein